jgi:hypothetical protein
MRSRWLRAKEAYATLLIVVSICLIIGGLAKMARADMVQCRSVYSVCTEGGCDAQPGWKTFAPCGIWCDPNDQFARVECQRPQG